MPARDRIAIGASAGGVTALRELVAGLPGDLHAAVFVTLHLFERSSRMILPELLNDAGPMRAAIAAEGEPIREGRIYIAPPDHHLQFAGETIQLGHGPREGLQRPSINVMFRAAAVAFGERVVGVVLTGMLDDGAAGLWEIGRHGGVTAVQEPDEAAYRSMPESAIRGVNVQYILRLGEIGPLLTRLSVGERRENQPQLEERKSGAAPSRVAASLQACPECGGAMHTEQMGGIKEYVCHVGHRLGLRSMIADKTDVVERAMYTALSQSEELVQLLEEAKADLDPATLGALPGEIASRRRHIETLRAVLQQRWLSGNEG